MKLSGTITDLPDREDYDADVTADNRRVADVGVKKPGKGRGSKRAARPSFFRVVFIDDTADEVMDDFEPGDVVTIDVDDASVHQAFELDEIGRSSVVIRCNGEGIEHGAPKR